MYVCDLKLALAQSRLDMCYDYGRINKAPNSERNEEIDEMRRVGKQMRRNYTLQTY